jgi:short-subunit dehydrogenase
MQTVVITGAASGIGRACALEWARRGARLGLVDRDRERLAAAAEGARALGATVSEWAVDLAQAEAIAQLARELEGLGAIDVLVNNAGVAVVKPFVATADEDWRWLLDVNVWAAIRLTRAVLPGMIARGRGHIAFTASLAGLVGAPAMVAYSTTKFALVGMAEALRHELPDAIGITVVCPGYVRTGLHLATRYANPTFQRFLDDPPRWYGVSPERTARRIADGVEAREPLIAIGVEKLQWYVKRVSPRLSSAIGRFAARRMGLVGDHR